MSWGLGDHGLLASIVIALEKIEKHLSTLVDHKIVEEEPVTYLNHDKEWYQKYTTHQGQIYETHQGYNSTCCEGITPRTFYKPVERPRHKKPTPPKTTEGADSQDTSEEWR